MKKSLLCFFAIFTFALIAQSQTTYYWVGGNGVAGSSSSVGTPVTWGPSSWNTSPLGTGSSRAISAGNDNLIFDGNSTLLTSGNKNIYLGNIPTDSCGQLQIINGAIVSCVTVKGINLTNTGYTTAGSTAAFFAAFNVGYSVGMPISGIGIAANTTIAALGPVLNLNSTSATTTALSNTVTLNIGNNNFIPGMTVSGTNIAANSVITAATIPTIISAVGTTGAPITTTASTGAPITTTASTLANLITTYATSIINSTSITLSGASPNVQIGMGISGAGIPAGTTVIAYDGLVTITLSNPTTSALLTKNALVIANRTLTLPTPNASIASGMAISGSGISTGTIITNYDGNVTLTISSNLTYVFTSSTVTISKIVTTTGTASIGGTSLVLAVANPIIQIGMGISGTGIPSGTTVSNYDGNVTVTLSAATTAAITAGAVVISSKALTLSAPNASIVPGMLVTGTGIPSKTTVISYDNALGVTLSANPTSALIAGTATFSNIISTTGTTVVLGDVALTLPSANALIKTGMGIFGTGIAPGTTISSYDGTVNIVLSLPTTAILTAGSITIASNTLTLSTPNPSIVVGMGILGAGIPNGTTISSYDGNVTINFSATPTAALVAGALTISSLQTLTLSLPATTSTAAGAYITLSAVSQMVTLSQAATATTVAGTPVTLTINADLGGVGSAGLVAAPVAYLGSTMQIVGTGANFTTAFRQGDFIIAGPTYNAKQMAEVLSVNSDNDMTISSDANATLTAGSYWKATSLYIKGNPGLNIDAASTLNLGQTWGSGSNPYVNGFIVCLEPGATGVVYGRIAWNYGGAICRIIALSPGALVFKGLSNADLSGYSQNPAIYPFGSAVGSGIASGVPPIPTSFVYNTTAPGVTFEAKSNYITNGNAKASGSAFGYGASNPTAPLLYSPAASFQPYSNYYQNATATSPSFVVSNSNAVYGNLIFNGNALPTGLLAAHIDTLTLNSTSTGSSNIGGGANIYKGIIINNPSIAVNLTSLGFFTFQGPSTPFINAITASSFTTSQFYNGINNISTTSTPVNFGSATFLGTATQNIGSTLSAAPSTSFSRILVVGSANVALGMNIKDTASVLISGNLDLGNYTINGVGTGSVATTSNLTSYGVSSKTYVSPASTLSITAGSTNISITGAGGTSFFVGALITSASHPTAFPAGTIVVSYTGTNVYVVSNPSTVTATGADVIPLSLTLSTSGGLTTANAAGLDGSLLGFTTTTLGTTSNFTFNGTTAQVPGTLIALPATVNNLTINNPAGVTLNTPATTVNGLLSITAGTLTTGANNVTLGTTGSATIGATGVLSVSGGITDFATKAVTLQSTVAGTGTISQILGTLNNATNVTVQRYIGGNGAWRTIGFPFTKATSIVTTAGLTSISSLVSVPAKAYYYDETSDDLANYGVGGANVNAGWKAVDATTVMAAPNGLLAWGNVAGSQTLSLTGAINTGDQAIALTKSKAGWNLLSNPFVSNVSWTSVAANAANSAVLGGTAAVYRVKPLGNGTYSFTSFVNGIATNGGSDVIENGAGFFVNAVTAGNLTIREADKTNTNVTTGGGLSLFGLGNTTPNTDNGSVRFSLSNNKTTYADEVIMKWSSAGIEKFDRQNDAYDLGTFNAPDLSVLGNDATRYSIFNGAALGKSDTENRTVKLGLTSLNEGTYSLIATTLSALANSNKAFIVDNYTHDAVVIADDSTSYSFTVTADPLSKTDGRLSVVMNYKMVDNAGTDFKLINNISTTNSVVLYSGRDYKKVNWNLIDISGRLIESGTISNVTAGSKTVINTIKTTGSMYFIHVTGDANYSQTLKWSKL